MRSKAIKGFLDLNGVKHLASRYHGGMEVQVNVAQDDGDVERTNRGKRYTDGVTSWSNFRMPKGAMGDPEPNDYDVRWDFAAHVSDIGMTGWDFANKVSRWVGYDFDSIANHADAGLTPIELEEVLNAVKQLEWAEIIRSTSGLGYHVYVNLPDVPTKNHTEHAALARAILARMSALTGHDFSNSVDVCGQILWVWSRRAKNNEKSFEKIRAGRQLLADEVPPNWKDHINVVKGTSRRVKMGTIPTDQASAMEMLTGQYPRLPLDDKHKELMQFLADNNCTWWWDKDLHMLVTHTVHLKKAHDELHCLGVFETNSSHSTDQNCFCYPLARGAWVVRRYGKMVNEANTWDIDDNGWTRAYFNQKPTLKTVARMHGGQEHPKGGYHFAKAESLQAAVHALGLPLEMSPAYATREARLILNTKNKVVVEVPKSSADNPKDLPDFIPDKTKFTKVVGTLFEMPEEPVPDCDDKLRHLVSVNDQNAGWVVSSGESWREEPLAHVRIFLDGMGMTKFETKEILGSCVANPWYLTNQPFQPEYPGGRKWNRDAARLNYPYDKSKTDLHYPTWESIMEHCGTGLDYAVKEDLWCQANDVETGKDYLMLWCASLFQCPDRPLPYLFFFGDQNSGKSTFHEAMALLFKKGYVLAKQALTNQQGFNGELLGAVLCVVEEVDLSVASSMAYNRIKEWVTNKQILIHPKGEQAFQVENATHWVQCANSAQYCPVFKGDSRIVVIETLPLSPTKLRPRYELTEDLQNEASDFLTALMSLQVPHSRNRLNIPVIETESKSMMVSQNQDMLEAFLDQECVHSPGNCISFKNFYEAFTRYCDPSELHYWTKIRVSKKLPPRFPSGGYAKYSNQKYIGNITFKGRDVIPAQGRFVNQGGKLVLIDGDEK